MTGPGHHGSPELTPTTPRNPYPKLGVWFIPRGGLPLPSHEYFGSNQFKGSSLGRGWSRGFLEGRLGSGCQTGVASKGVKSSQRGAKAHDGLAFGSHFFAVLFLAVVETTVLATGGGPSFLSVN